MIKQNAGNWSEWPECPQCHERREARCSACLARGTDFRLADTEEVEDGEAEVLLLCSTCDEPFTPQFYRSCTKCGFDFGEGIEPPELEQREALNSRVVFVTVGVLLLLVGLLGFFALVLRG